MTSDNQLMAVHDGGIGGFLAVRVSAPSLIVAEIAITTSAAISNPSAVEEARLWGLSTQRHAF